MFDSNHDENEMLEDWSNDQDDWGAEAWGAYLSGPDDTDIERLQEQSEDRSAWEDTEIAELNRSALQDSVQPKPMDENSGCGSKAMSYRICRQLEIVKWLADSDIARPLRRGDGFYVPRGMHVVLNDGNAYDALDWLFDEGLTEGRALRGYSLAYTPAGGPYREKLTFFKMQAKAPFAPSGELAGSRHDIDEEIPF